MTTAGILRGAFLVLPLLGAVACDDDDDGGGGPDGTVMVEAVFDEDDGFVEVTDGGAPVTGAAVVLNGTAGIPSGTDGRYVVGLGTPVGEGGALELAVTAGDAVVAGSGTVPVRPALTAPNDGAIYSTSQDIQFTWTSDEDPDRWIVGTGSLTGIEEFDVPDGGARSFTIPAGSLGPDEWGVRVLAIHDGEVTGDAEAGSTMAVQAETETRGITVVSPVLVTGQYMGPQIQEIAVFRDGTRVEGATVTVNGEAAVQTDPDPDYVLVFAAPLAAGDGLVLDIAFGDVVIQGLGDIPEAPVMTAPSDGAVIAVANAVDVTWTATIDPSKWIVVATDGVNTYEVEVAGTQRAAAFAAGALPVGGPYTIQVISSNDGAFTGPVAAESRMNIRNHPEEDPPRITVTP